MSPLLLLLVTALAGGIGAGLRLLVDAAVSSRTRGRFPVGILVVNVTGSLALGVLTGAGLALHADLLVVLGTGLLGGYTTFSSVAVETALMIEQRRPGAPWANLLGTLLLSCAAAALGLLLGASLLP